MADNGSDLDAETVASELRTARLAYGAGLVDDELQMIEYIDESAFEDGPDRSMLTALTSVGADLVPFVDEFEFDGDLPLPAMPYQADDVPLTRVTTLEGAVDLLAEARAYYVILDRGDGEWSRIRETDSAAFENGPIDTPQAGRYAVARTLVAESTDRTAEFDVEVDEDDPIRPITWTE